MSLSTSPRSIQGVLVAAGARPSASRPAGRREKAVCIASPQECGGSAQRKVRGHAIER